MDYQTIRISTEEEGICILTMDRPEALNAFSGAVIAELSNALDWIEQQENIRVVIITGAGKAFVAGADIAYMSKLSPDQARSFSSAVNRAFEKINRSGKVFIAAVNGYAFGGGCEYSLACDLRIASEKARFGLPEVGLGIIPGSGGTQRLPRLIGTQRAAVMMLTGEPVKAEEALAIGLVCKVVPPDELFSCALDMARRIMKNAPLAVKYAKECIRQSEQVELSAGIDIENMMFGLCFATPDQREGMSAFLEKRPPEFQKNC